MLRECRHQSGKVLKKANPPSRLLHGTGAAFRAAGSRGSAMDYIHAGMYVYVICNDSCPLLFIV